MITTKPCIKRLNYMPDKKKVPFQHCQDSQKRRMFFQFQKRFEKDLFESRKSKKIEKIWVIDSSHRGAKSFSSTQMQHPKSMTDTNRDDKVKTKQLKTKSIIKRERCRV